MKMRKSLHKFLALALAICLLVPMLAACNQEVDAATIMSQYRLANNAIDLSVGDVTGLTIIDESLSDADYDQTWTSDNPSVVSVSNGIVTAVGPGSATVTVTIARTDIDPFNLTCAVTVTQDVIPVETIMLNTSVLTMDAGSTNVLSAVVLPTDATDKTLVWTSSDPSVATVISGIVSGISAGTAQITASTVDGLVSATCTVTVEPLVDLLTSFSISKSSVSLYVGKSTTLKATYEPADALVSVVWTSSDNSVATVEDGVVKAIATGKATITASYTDKVTTWEKTCTVTVTKQSTSSGDSGSSGNSGSTTPTTPSTPTTVKATKVKLDKNTFYINIGEVSTWKITPTVTPANTTEKGVWTSSDPSLVTVDSEGNAKVVATSLSENALETVTLKYTVGSVFDAAVVVLQDKGSSTPSTPSTPSDPTTPSEPTTEINLVSLGISQANVSVNVGESSSLTIVKNPANADETITWSSADPTIAVVDQTGKVTGVKAGSTVIFAKSSRTGMQATSVVIVTAKTSAASGITLSSTSATLEAGAFINLKASLVPATATSNIVWTSSMPTVASVDQTGKVTGIAMGTAVITATTDNGLSASCVVTVTAVTIKNITVTVKLNTTEELRADKVYTATVQFSPALSASDIADFYYDIYSDDTSVVNTSTSDYTSMTNSFTVIPGADGVANLYPYIVTSRANFNFTYVPLSVAVNSPSEDIKTPVKTITLSVANGSQTMYAGDKLGLSVKVTPNTHDDVLTWTTSDASVATVENGVVTAVGPGVATITYRAKGNLTTNGVSKSIKVTVQDTGSMNEAFGRITIMQGTSFKATLNASKGTAMSWSLPTAIPGVLVDGTTGTITVDASVAAGTTFQLICYYRDLAGQYQMATYNVVVQRAATASGTNAYAKYSITVEDDVDYEWTDFGMNFSGYIVEDDYTDDCYIDCNDDGITARLAGDDKGSAKIVVYDGDTKIAEVSVTIVQRDFVISMSKSSTVNIEREVEDFLDVNDVTIHRIIIDSKYEDYLEEEDTKYVKAKGKSGSAIITIMFANGGELDELTATVEIN